MQLMGHPSVSSNAPEAVLLRIVLLENARALSMVQGEPPHAHAKILGRLNVDIALTFEISFQRHRFISAPIPTRWYSDFVWLACQALEAPKDTDPSTTLFSPRLDLREIQNQWRFWVHTILFRNNSRVPTRATEKRKTSRWMSVVRNIGLALARNLATLSGDCLQWYDLLIWC